MAFLLSFVSVAVSHQILLFLSNDSFEGEPEEKRRKTANVVIDRPATEHKVVIDNVPCVSSLLEEVRVLHHHTWGDPGGGGAPSDGGCVLRLTSGPWRASVRSCATTSSTRCGR